MMITLKKGDPCPCCGQPIQTDDPFRLKLLALIAEELARPDDKKEAMDNA